MGAEIKHFTLEQKDDNTNDRLEKEYKSAISDVEEDPENDGPVSPMGKAIERGAFEAATFGDKNKTKDEEIKRSEEENAKPLKQRAKEKLEKELNDAKDKNFADPVIKYLLKRCEEDDGLSSDVLQPHKTWTKCFTYIYEQARKQRDGNCAAVRDDVVYEWAEDYFHLDDKAIEEKKKKEEEKRKKQQKQEAEKRKKQNAKQKPVKEKKPEKTPDVKPVKEVKKQAPKKNETEGQMSLFDLL